MLSPVERINSYISAAFFPRSSELVRNAIERAPYLSIYNLVDI